jgi:hypothetical protein
MKAQGFNLRLKLTLVAKAAPILGLTFSGTVPETHCVTTKVLPTPLSHRRTNFTEFEPEHALALFVGEPFWELNRGKSGNK